MKKQIFGLVMWGVVCVGVGAAPTTNVAVSHPSTRVSVTHPQTSGAVNRPHTAVTVSRPQTAVSVSHPATSAPVSHPVTSVAVVHPQTGAVSSGKETPGVAQPTKQAIDNSATAPAAQKGSMMSSYQAPQAKDLKAAKLGGGEQGLGNKTNEAEKDSSAASFKPPKALTYDEAKAATEGTMKSKIQNAVKPAK